MSTLIKSGRIVTAEQDYTADIFIEKKKITTIGADLALTADAVFDATGKYVIPGGIDVHPHMDMPQWLGRAGHDAFIRRGTYTGEWR
jgi:dihydropyrimidinase